MLFSFTFEAVGREVQWFGGIPGAVQESALLLRSCAFRFLRVHEAIRAEIPICPMDSIHYALIPALTSPRFSVVIVVKVSFPPIVQMEAIFCSDHISRFGLLRQLDLADQCTFDGDEPCVRCKNGVPISDHPVFVHHADFVSCYKEGRSYTLVEEEAVIIFDIESVVVGPLRHTGGFSGSNGDCLHGGTGVGFLLALLSGRSLC